MHRDEHLKTVLERCWHASIASAGLAFAALVSSALGYAAAAGWLGDAWAPPFLVAAMACSGLLLVLVAAGFQSLRSSILLADEARQAALEAAHRDQMTGAFTRAYFLSALRARVHHGSVARHAYLQIDMDRLKALNDAYGHAAGDEAILQLVSAVRAELPDALIGRLGGDEFGVLMANHGSRADVTAAAARILDRLGQPVSIAGRPTRLSATIGVALAPEDAALPFELVSHADLALYRGKERRGGVVAYDEEMLVNARYGRFLTRELRAAIYLDQLDLHYQPVMDADGRVVGHEALVRWNHPVRGLIPPSDFVPLAEQSTLIEDLGAWVLGRVCRDLPRMTSPAVGINVSPAQLKCQGFADKVLARLRAHGIAGSRMVVEITETVLLDAGSVARANIGRLREAGIRVALDDFGAGHTSVDHLRQLDFDIIKIDRSYVQAAPRDTVSMAIVSALTSIARAMNVEVLAEGIETEEQLAIMRAAGCRLFQGYLLGRPMALRPSPADRTAGAGPFVAGSEAGPAFEAGLRLAAR
ncbi:putative bifunctional diguanylate cyclase/phosphodiesterase [Chthonobacter rhizosphaerae]|uniref:putative bifunctional diguanylate cyclase/phosphodiesterase n=1 Tax=Chthonobacter rhizosphaerae TaxID=2735553 RepID=UPI0015EE4C8E|nr:bifunctional diguanylate cyclase/phosphodiesterase [Chthonobacter rhizosphaerae]